MIVAHFSAVSLLLAMSFSASAEELMFNRDIRPILSDNCFYCHGFDPKHREGDRRLDSFEEATADRDGVRAIVPGDPSKSELWLRLITTDEDDLMPPKKAHKTVTEAQRAMIKKWIEQGAKYEGHWSFTPPAKVEVPVVKNESWPLGEVDRFILARLEKERLSPSLPASKEMLLRRVTLDLTGLPPTPAEVDAFLLDSSPGAYEAVVDRLLKSQRFGERMAVDWLDAARYADTHGFNNDSARSMWRWRDWVIDSFNENLPYDRFITEQLAGDLLPQPSVNQRIATGFSRNHVVNSEGGIIPEEYRVEYVADRVRTTSQAWLGLTMECARCHDHKFDPITQKDFYSMFAFFNNVDESGEDGRTANAAPIMPAPTREQQAMLAEQRTKLAEMDKRLAAMKAARGTGVSPVGTLGVPPDATGETPVVPTAGTAVLPVFHLDCENAEPIKERHRFTGAAPLLVDGVTGKAWRAAEGGRFVEFDSKALDSQKMKTFSLWLKPDADNPRDVALFSNTNYDGEISRIDFGKGEEIRLIDGEIEVRVNDRFPAYAARVRTVGARIGADQWRNVAVVFGEGAIAQFLHIYVDGERQATVNPNIGSNGRAKTKVPFGLGADRSKNAVGYRGALDELRVYDKPLDEAQVSALFAADALPFAAARAASASVLERSWLDDARQRAQDATFAKLSDERRALWAQHIALERSAPTVMTMIEMATPRPTFVLKRGVYDALGEPVTARVPEQFAPWPKDAPKNRLGLAQWFTQPQHPLTSRVVVNRLWAQVFGTGLVKTLEDFGSQGEYPSHPELLDWLARHFVEDGWDVKAMVRTLVLSATYRQASRVTPELLARDPENRLLARAPRLRLQAEFLRDQALAVSGLLHEQVGGPSVYPEQPADFLKGVVVDGGIPGSKWEVSKGGDLFRRSLYTFWKRTALHPVMGTFDAPERETCSVRRSRTNTPLQALVLMNEPGFVAAAKALGERMEKEGGDTDASRLSRGFLLATGRKPVAAELAELQRALDDARAAAPATAFAAVGSILLNLDELITRE